MRLFSCFISQGKNFLPLIDNEETLYKIIDTALKYFPEQAKPRERLKKMFERLGTEDFKEIVASKNIS